MWLVYPSTSASKSDNIVFTRSSITESEENGNVLIPLTLTQCAYDSTYDSNLWFSQGHKCSYDYTYDSDCDSVASENQS